MEHKAPFNLSEYNKALNEIKLQEDSVIYDDSKQCEQDYSHVDTNINELNKFNQYGQRIEVNHNHNINHNYNEDHIIDTRKPINNIDKKIKH